MQDQNERDEVLAAVKQDGSALKHASKALKSNREVVLAAVKQRGYALKYAPDALKSDREVVLAAVEKYGDALKYASDALRDNKEVVLAAVKQFGDALYNASDALKSDREVVLAAVKSAGDALKYAPEELKSDREFVLAAVKEDGYALYYASADIQEDFWVQVASATANKYPRLLMIESLLVPLLSMISVALQPEVNCEMLKKLETAVEDIGQAIQKMDSNDALLETWTGIAELIGDIKENPCLSEDYEADFRYDNTSKKRQRISAALAQARLQLGIFPIEPSSSSSNTVSSIV
jgi:hypothetical protein